LIHILQNIAIPEKPPNVCGHYLKPLTNLSKYYRLFGSSKTGNVPENKARKKQLKEDYVWRGITS
jgi:hypothetical protein